MSLTLSRDLLDEIDRLTSGCAVATPKRSRAGEWDWYWTLATREREYIARRYFAPNGVAVDVLAGMVGMGVDEWADAFVAAVRGSRAKSLRDADVFSDEFADASWSLDSEEYDGGVEDLSELVGPGEVAAMFAVKANTVAQWRQRFEDFPTPVLTLSGMYIWRRADVATWGEKHGRIAQ